MADFSYIQEFVQTFSENISEVLGFDITIINENGIRISGTGSYKYSIGEPSPEGSYLRKIMETKKPAMIHDVIKNESQCMSCKFMGQCKVSASIGFPILKRDRSVGVIGIMGFSPEQKERMIRNSEMLIRFLHHMSALLEKKLLLLDYIQESGCDAYEEDVAAFKNVAFDSIVGHNTGLQDVIKKAKRVANSPSTVLIRGDSGTGKELLAQAIHYESNRRKNPFVAINCAAIPENLLESELFGYEGGAFTGSRREGNIGKFEYAHKGTLFLDEIGDMPISLQPKLLRVLQERSIERIGGKKIIPIDVRVIAATHRNLEEMVEKGTFREDLYYRLNVIPLHTKPLKERRDDIMLFLRYFIRKHCRILKINELSIDPVLEQWLIQYDWPGNIRQLENAVEYMVNIAELDTIEFHDLPDYLGKQENFVCFKRGLSLEQMIAEYEKNILQTIYFAEPYRNDKEKISQELQISLSTLYRKLEKYQLV
ncbi:sigma-54 interaction domain-containing protein [Brevibacillus choshinensis]|uniref:sigma-54 interaction domain-containing protein n=1 Tax=Brevibacillus choshinensis TaxID=54911 RepID=UPI002E246563|nr:sigma 54-interacting transcriptional regulator [Brevibacillus choshinensis]MED4584531.1 sigma 54-interacting transcriptional regulator [Brevibacillus choshinensis]MED4753172.1 sigma 54-interacting transcriptional regulator [Brevibacillus choshinensis]